ncbi:unnamed protein product [Sphagnum troendelagicum]|uniref:Transcription factor MYC/MYB N-terminal domain-containing protein n=1 Tax=Sphagnum troendelagicum TaxID=128251 RepID=A0ABP0TRC3_9BRYO
MERKQQLAHGGRLQELNHLLQHTLRSLCIDSQWVYAVFWRILPRNYPPPQWESESEAMDRSRGNKRNWIMVWEDGFCNFSACGGDQQPAFRPDLFFKMSHEVYNYGEGLMGKVAADNGLKWVYREPPTPEQESSSSSFLSPWAITSLDPHPRHWEAQFKAGIQTIAVVAVEEGVLQLGSTKKIMKDLNFAAEVQRKFGYLQSIPGVFVPHSFFNTAAGSSSCSSKKRISSISESLRGGQWMSMMRGQPELHLHLSNLLLPWGTSSTGGHYLQQTSTSIDQLLLSSPGIAAAGIDGSWSRCSAGTAASSLSTISRQLSHPDQAAQTGSILGVKRPLDGAGDQTHDQGAALVEQLPAPKSSYAFDMSGSFLEDTSTTLVQPKSGSSPPDKALINSSRGSQKIPGLGQLEPSMSSLQALLSKLPSVTPVDQPENGSASCSSEYQQQQALQLSDLCITASTIAAGTTAAMMQIDAAASANCNTSNAAASSTSTTSTPTTDTGPVILDHAAAANSSKAEAAAAAEDNQLNSSSSFDMESFDTLSDLAGLPDTSSLDCCNNDDMSYHSFLNQIYSS